jgi:hypothetical protein
MSSVTFECWIEDSYEDANPFKCSAPSARLAAKWFCEEAFSFDDLRGVGHVEVFVREQKRDGQRKPVKTYSVVVDTKLVVDFLPREPVEI